METQPVSDDSQGAQKETIQAGALKTSLACIAGALIPGLGHAFFGKWVRAAVFFFSIGIMLALGLQLQGKLYGPELGEIFSTLKFVAQTGSGLLYWIPLIMGAGAGDPTAYTYDYANVFLYVAGLLNMLVIVDVFDIALGRKQ
jgi:hypothetical protein